MRSRLAVEQHRVSNSGDRLCRNPLTIYYIIDVKEKTSRLTAECSRLSLHTGKSSANRWSGLAL